MKNKKLLDAFYYIHDLFSQNGFSLYMVGGSVRDYLLNKEVFDLDVVTNATPKQMKEFLVDANYTFMRFGSVHLKIDDINIDITTLRKEAGYVDSRHPNNIEFCDSLEVDVLRRDFTINGLYLDSNLKVIDYVGGVENLNRGIIKMIGDPDIRIKEDPLRIVRALRFSINLGFKIDDELFKSLKRNINLLDKLNPDKIKQELKKCMDEKKLLDSLNHLKNL